MPELANLSFFVAATLLLLVIPGPAVLYVVARTIDQGRLAGFVSILGISFGTLFHIAAAAFGASALLAASTTAFNAIKYLGAAYLIVLGVQKLRTREETAPVEIDPKQELRRVFWQGAIVNLTNPKTALFFFAFLPQFADPAQGSVAVQILFLGLLFVLLAILSDGLWAFLAGFVRTYLAGNPRFLNGQRNFAGAVFIALGLATAFSGSRAK